MQNKDNGPDLKKIALLFPGQGSQAVGMGKEMAGQFDKARSIYDEANDLLGYDIARLCFEGPDNDLTQTKHSQLAIFITSVALLRVIEDAAPGLAPVAAAGLSLGEFTAHVAAGSFSFADGVRLVRQRAEAMQEACERTPSTMASIVGLEIAMVQEVCDATRGQEVLDIANLNSPGQIAISGSSPAVERAMAEAERRGAAKVVRLQVSGAFHSALMRPAEEKLRSAIEAAAIVSPRYPVIANVTAQAASTPAEIRETLVRQLCSPVLWEKSVQGLISRGVTTFLEVGHGRILSGLLRRIDKTAKAVNVQDPASLAKTVEALAGKAGGGA
ncbi:MAG: ACP S-malonyltransferase [Candidatus Aureabacteria bacterium]|nr:ACP S-malonyltransferase [Candidatus Auribacterota bacterium]